MSETVENLVNAIRAGDALETEHAFGAAMAEKLGDRLETMRQSIAQSMFNQVVDVPSTEEAPQE